MNFDPIAPYYIETRQKKTEVLVDIARSILENDLAEQLRGRPRIRVFEAGCGTGFFLHAFLQANDRVAAEGWDISERMLSEAKTNIESPLRDIPEHRYTLVQRDFLSDEAAGADIAISHLFLHLLPEWRTALDKILRLDGLLGYVHLFEDCDYFSIVTGNSTLLPDDHPIFIIGQILRETLGTPEKPFGTPGPYLPSSILRHVRENHAAFRLTAVRSVSWTRKYLLEDFIKGLMHRVMSTYHVGDERTIGQVIGKVKEKLGGFNAPITLPHDLWAFVLSRSNDRISRPKMQIHRPTLEREEVVHRLSKKPVEAVSEVYSCLDDLLKVSLADYDGHVRLCSASAFFKDDTNKRLVAWWGCLPRAELASWYESVKHKTEDNEDASPTRYVQKNFSHEKPPRLFELVFDRERQKTSLRRLAQDGTSDPEFEPRAPFPDTTNEIMRALDDLWELFSPNDSAHVYLVLPLLPSAPAGQPGVIFIAGNDARETHQAINAAKTIFREFASVPKDASSPEIATVVEHSFFAGVRSIAHLPYSANNANYETVFPVGLAHLFRHILDPVKAHDLSIHLQKTNVVGIIQSVEEYCAYLSGSTLKFVPQHFCNFLAAHQKRIVLCKLEAQLYRDRFNPLGLMLAVYRRSPETLKAFSEAIIPLLECLADYDLMSDDDQKEFRREVLDGFKSHQTGQISRPIAWAQLCMRALPSILEEALDQTRSASTGLIVYPPNEQPPSSALAALKRLASSSSIWAEIRIPCTGFVSAFLSRVKATNAAADYSSASDLRELIAAADNREQRVFQCPNSESLDLFVNSHMQFGGTQGALVCADESQTVFRFQLYSDGATRSER